MKQIYLAITLFLFTSVAAIGQDKSGLELMSHKGNQFKYISEGSKVSVYKYGKKYKGNLKVLSDKAILINSDTILVSQIQQLCVQTPSSQLGGLGLAVPGAFISGGGLALLGAGIIQAEGVLILMGIVMSPITAIGIFGTIKGVQLLSRGKKFSSSRWKYTIAVVPPAVK